jgi:hypothetical protein
MTRRKFYRLDDDIDFPRRWHVWEPYDAAGAELWGWEFTQANYLSALPQPVSLSVQLPGVDLDYTEAYGFPLVTPALADAIARIAGPGIQRIAARVNGMTQPFEIINVLEARSCVDEARSEIMYWRESDSRPDKLGEFRMITDLVLDAVRVRRGDLFRIKEYTVLLLCSEDFKAKVESQGFTGMRFQEVRVDG